MGVTVESLDAAVLQELGKLPRVTGSGREADRYYVARPVDEALNRAEKLAVGAGLCAHDDLHALKLLGVFHGL